jgi:hypothetical protein
MEHKFYPYLERGEHNGKFMCYGCETVDEVPAGTPRAEADRILKEKYRGRTCNKPGGGAGH